MIKRIFAMLLLLCIVVCCFSCNKGETQDITDSAESNNDIDASENKTEYITIAENKVANYQLVYETGATESIRNAVLDICNLLKKKAGVTPLVHDDFLPKGQQYDAESYEILIGKTDYPESRDVLDKIAFGDWCICVKGNKIVITAYSEEALQTAITKFIVELKNAEDDGIIRLPADLHFSETLHVEANFLPEYDGGELPEVVDSGDDTALFVISNTTLEEYDHYLAKLEALGFTYHSSNKIVENCFATYYNDTHLIHAGFYDYEDSARITIEKKTSIVPLKTHNTYSTNSSVTTSLAQIGLSTEANEYSAIGMAYVFQLEDGSFIVVDGGFFPDADRIYDYMKMKSPNEKIVIASWFITHNDVDHSRCIGTFIQKYKDSVTFEQIVFNFPTAYNSDEQEMGAKIAIDSLENCRIIKAHTGQKFYIRNAVIEILYTLDSYFPEALPIFNNSSLVFTVDLEGERIMFTGDASDEAMKILVDMYGDYLKCDILQNAHHGERNGHGLNMPSLVKAYEIMRPSMVLWPSGNRAYLNTSNKGEAYQYPLYPWNKVICSSAREIYIAGEDYATVFELPYEYFSAQKVFITKE